jgi:hypothetical protein
MSKNHVYILNYCDVQFFPSTVCHLKAPLQATCLILKKHYLIRIIFILPKTEFSTTAVNETDSYSEGTQF